MRCLAVLRTEDNSIKIEKRMVITLDIKLVKCVDRVQSKYGENNDSEENFPDSHDIAVASSHISIAEVDQIKLLMRLFVSQSSRMGIFKYRITLWDSARLNAACKVKYNAP